jgi:hypothetical protein
MRFDEKDSAKTKRLAYRQVGCFIVPPRKDTTGWWEFTVIE